MLDTSKQVDATLAPKEGLPRESATVRVVKSEGVMWAVWLAGRCCCCCTVTSCRNSNRMGPNLRLTRGGVGTSPKAA